MKKMFMQVLAFAVALWPDKQLEGKEQLELSEEELSKLDAESGTPGLGEKFLAYYNDEYVKAEAGANSDFAKFMSAYDEAMKANGIEAAGAENETEEDPDKVVPDADAKTLADKLSAVVKKADGLLKTNAQLAADNEKLKKLPEPDVPEAVITLPGAKANTVKHSKTHLFASGHQWDSLEREWNKNAAGITPEKMKSATVWDKVNIDKLNEDLGAYARRNSNEIVNLLMDGYDVPANWNVISNVQDELIMTQVVTGSITQGFKKAFLPKNKNRFVPIKNKIFDKQIDGQWQSSELKSIEKSWLNMFFNEGSTPYKMSFARFLIERILEMARKEDKISMFKGVHFDTELLPEGTPGSYLNAMDGFLKLIEGYRDTVYKSHKIGKPTLENCYNYTKDWVKSLPYDFRSQAGLELGLSEDWHKAIHNAREFEKGTNNDYSAQDSFVDQYPNVQYIVHPQLNGSDFMYITTPNNIGLMVDRPGEESTITIQMSQPRTIDFFADYKLGVYLSALGAEVDPDAPITYENQIFFSNDVQVLDDVYSPVVADDATPSVENHHALIVGSNNTSATNITSLDDVVEGTRYFLFGDTDTNISTVKDGTNIILADGDFALNKGNLIELIGLAGGKVVEYSRTVAGTVAEPDKVQLAADVTTPDAEAGNHFVTTDNTGATAITTILNAIKGEEYTIEGGSDTNATTVADGGNFLLTANFTANDGSVLKVIYNGSKFVELSRA